MLKRLVTFALVLFLGVVITSVVEARSAAEIAIEEAKKYSGQTLTVTWESGLQAQGIRAILPEWEEKTGVKINLVELSFWDL
ncbi:MAG: hypothetical protein ABDK94_08440, partial [Atribacterota bacterium]